MSSAIAHPILAVTEAGPIFTDKPSPKQFALSNVVAAATFLLKDQWQCPVDMKYQRS